MKKPLPVLMALAHLSGLAGLLGMAGCGAADEGAEVGTEVAVHVGTVTRQTLRAWVTAYGVVEPEPPGVHSTAGARVGPLRGTNCPLGGRECPWMSANVRGEMGLSC